MFTLIQCGSVPISAESGYIPTYVSRFLAFSCLGKHENAKNVVWLIRARANRASIWIRVV